MDALSKETAREGKSRTADNKQQQPTLTENQLTRQAKWQAANPIARWAHLATATAIRRGILTVPTHCEACGKEEALDAHHPNHRAALDVKFWCRKCHSRHHARQRKAGGK